MQRDTLAVPSKIARYENTDTSIRGRAGGERRCIESVRDSVGLPELILRFPAHTSDNSVPSYLISLVFL